MVLLQVKVTADQREWVRERAERTGLTAGAQVRAMIAALMEHERRREQKRRELVASLAHDRALLAELADGDILERSRLRRQIAETERELDLLRIA